MYPTTRFTKLISFEDVSIGQQFVEQMFGRAYVYFKAENGVDDEGCPFNAYIIDQGVGRECLFYPDDKVLVEP